MKLGPAPTYPPIDLDSLCEGEHEYGEPVLYAGLLGPSLRIQCRNCTAHMHATNMTNVDAADLAGTWSGLAIVRFGDDGA